MGKRFKQAIIDADELRELLSYEPEKGVFLWKARSKEHFESDQAFRHWNTRYAGTQAGTILTGRTGYQRVQIRIKGRTYKAHRLAWLYMTGEWPENQIDHCDRDGTNNRWENLRQSNQKENGKNQSKRKNNTSGVTGVTWNKRNNKWVAQVFLEGKNNYLGSFHEGDIDLAAMEVMEFRAENGFDPQHGIHSAPYYREDGLNED
jgi:hypothetical protein